MADETKTYVERHANEKLRMYRITSTNGRYMRYERENGQLVMVSYTAFGGGGKSTVLLTEKSAEALSHLKLVPVGADAPVVLKETDANRKKVPADWETLSKLDRIKLAKELTGASYRSAEEADKAIADYIAGVANEDDDQ